MLKLTAEEPEEPYKPYEVEHPKKFIETHHSIYFDSHKTYTFQDIQIEISKLGVSLNDIRFSQKFVDNGCDTYEYLSVYYIKKTKNPNYSSQLKIYKKMFKKYMKDLDKYSLELEEYRSSLQEYFDCMKTQGYKESLYHKGLREKYDIK